MGGTFSRFLTEENRCLLFDFYIFGCDILGEATHNKVHAISLFFTMILNSFESLVVLLSQTYHPS